MTVVFTRVDDGVAVLTIDNPPVNTGNATLRCDLLAAVQGIQGRDDVIGAVLCGAGPHFYSGSDISEFDGDVAKPLLTEVIALIDALDIPFVAALNGMTLGGGLEVALGCDLRIAEPRAKLGLPETTLGMLPGAGGTVRLPRLVGVPTAIELIASGRAVSAADALGSGLVDEIVEKDELIATAIDRARTTPKRRARTLAPPAASDAEIAAAVSTASRRARPNVLRAIELVRTGVDLDSDAALARERAAFDELRLGAEARNLRYLFFAKRSAAKQLAVPAEPLPFSTIGIAGAGTMGASIAAACLGAGLGVVLFDLDAGARDRATASLAEKGAARSRWGVLTTVDSLEGLAPADLVIDAVFEDMAVKTEFLTAVEKVVRDDAVLASNTSYLDLDQLASRLRRPRRFAGLHFFNPGDRNPLVEVVRTGTSDDVTLATIAALVKKLGKTGIPARVGDGFVANRVYADYRGQAEILVEDGASPQQVDQAMEAFGLAIGPFAVGDMSGLDIAWSRRKRLAETRDPAQRYVVIPDRLCEAGRLGKKSGAGWYRYPDGATRGEPDPAVDAIIDAARAEKGIVTRVISTEEIQQRIICAMLVAAAQVVGSGIAASATDVDVALTEGFAFPKWTGGPVRFSASQPDAWVVEGLAAVYASDPIGYALAEPAARGEIPPAVAAVRAAAG